MAATTFTEIYNARRPGLFESGQHIRGGTKGGREVYYTHDPLVPTGRGSEALKRRREKYAKGAEIVQEALRNEYTPKLVDTVLSRVRDKVHRKTGRDIDKEITRGDLELIHKELNRKPTTFKQLHEMHGPGLFGIGQGDYLHAEDAGPGLVRLHTHAPVGRAPEYQAKINPRSTGAQLVWQAIVRDYGKPKATAVFAEVSRLRRRDINQGMTRGDLELLRELLDKKPSKQPTEFSDILQHFAPVLDEKRDEPVRGKITKDAKQVYLHYQGLLDACWPEDQEWREKRHKDGATLVKQAIATQYGEQVAIAVLAKVGKDTGGRNLEKEITLRDLALLKQELQRVEAMKGLHDALTKARPNDRLPKAMFERFEQLKAMADDEGKALFTTVVEPLDSDGYWAFAFKIGDREIYRSDRLQNGPGQYHIEFALRQAIEANQLRSAVLLDPQAYLVGSNIRFMSDDPDQQTWITNNLDNPACVGSNFRGIKDVDAHPNLFRAVFRVEDGERVELEFSNRTSTTGEMRGKTLRDAFEAGQYTNLREIVAPGHLSNDDILKQAMANMWVNIAATMGFENGAALTDHFAKLPREEWSAVDDILRGIAFGSTSLADLYLPAPVPAEAQAAEDAELVKQAIVAIVAQYGKVVANQALAVVSRDVGHDLREKMTPADLKLLEQELPRRQQRYRELKDAIKSGGSPRTMFEAFERFTAGVDDRRKDRFRAEVEPLDGQGRWAFAFKIGDNAIYRSARLQDGPGQHRDEFALRPAEGAIRR